MTLVQYMWTTSPLRQRARSGMLYRPWCDTSPAHAATIRSLALHHRYAIATPEVPGLWLPGMQSASRPSRLPAESGCGEIHRSTIWTAHFAQSCAQSRTGLTQSAAYREVMVPSRHFPRRSSLANCSLLAPGVPQAFPAPFCTIFHHAPPIPFHVF
jgi:hypothetical protein